MRGLQNSQVQQFQGVLIRLCRLHHVKMHRLPPRLDRAKQIAPMQSLRSASSHDSGTSAQSQRPSFGKPQGDLALLQVAAAYEAVRSDWLQRRPA